MKRQVINSIMCICFLSSCIYRDPATITETIIYNSSKRDVNYVIYGMHNKSSIDTIFIFDGESYETTNVAIGYYSIFPGAGDSVEMIFDCERVVKYFPFVDDSNKYKNVFSMEAYEKEKIKEGHFRFIYTITEEDYNNATPIN